MNVKLIRINTGEDVIANLIEDDVYKVTFKNAIVAFPTDVGKIGFGPWSPLLNEDEQLTISKTHVIYIADPRQDIVDQYEQMYGSKLVTPNKNLII